VIVVDASIAIKWFVEEEDHSLALALLEKKAAITVPDLILAETANVLWKKIRSSEVTLEQAAQACSALPDYFATVIPASSLINESLNLASRLDHPVYDCIDVICAQKCGGRLVTADKKFAAKLKDSGLRDFVIDLDDGAAISQIISPGGVENLPDNPKTQPE
jgi:predicted nucleic acid-binding protein